MIHTCHVPRCSTTCPPKHLMCARHWRMVPRHLQKKVWDTYVTGQEVRKDPTPEWHEAADAAIAAVTQLEG